MKKQYEFAFLSLAINVAFSTYNIIIGFTSQSWWLLTLGTYYAVLSIIRFTVLRSKKENRIFLKRFTGILLVITSIPIAGTVILTTVKDRLDFPIYNEPMSYVRLLLSGKLEEYLRNSTDYTPLSSLLSSSFIM